LSFIYCYYLSKKTHLYPPLPPLEKKQPTPPPTHPPPPPPPTHTHTDDLIWDQMESVFIITISVRHHHHSWTHDVATISRLLKSRRHRWKAAILFIGLFCKRALQIVATSWVHLDILSLLHFSFGKALLQKSSSLAKEKWYLLYFSFGKSLLQKSCSFAKEPYQKKNAKEKWYPVELTTWQQLFCKRAVEKQP